MRRLLVILFGTAALLAGAVFALGAGGDESDDPRFVVEMDNAFGLIEGADVKVAGVRAGKITSLEIDRESYRALVGIEITAEGYGDLRKDVFCESRPQSLIGEYFIDCLPGTAEEKLEPGSRIPVERTGSTVPADLLNNIWRRPTRERFSILIGELGAALAGRGEDLNETIRRANPALRETDKVLAVLAEQRATIRDLTATAEDVVTRLAASRQDVSRFIAEARDTAQVSAVRKEELRAQFQRFPVFLRELRPTMRLLGQTADAQAPALATLAAQTPRLEAFFNTLGPFSEASRPAMRTLAGAARAGRPAFEAATPRIEELKTFADDLPEVADNLDITLNHLHDRDFAVEPNVNSPGGKGYTGFEAILQYIFSQSQATNVFDANSYLLKVSAFLDNNCAQYADAEDARRPDRQYCRAILGPNQPGIDDPDPTATTPTRSTPRKRAEADATPTPEADGLEDDLAPVLDQITDPTPDATATPEGPLDEVLKPIQDITDALPRLPELKSPELRSPELGSGDVGPLLDFLVGP
jgi:virulence factor Mce-like protein